MSSIRRTSTRQGRVRHGFARRALPVVVLASSLLFSTQAGAATAPTAAADWPMFHAGPTHLGVAADTAIGASSAAGLHTAWRVDIGHPSFSSPAIVFNPSRGIAIMYAGEFNGNLVALDADTGATVWTFHTPPFKGLSQHINSSPAVYNGVVYFGSDDHRLWALDATTGALDCSFDTGGKVDASPVVGEPDASGPVVYFGDEGPSDELSDGGHEWAVNGVGNTHGECTRKWMYDQFGNPPGSATGIASGSYSSPALVTDRKGRMVVVFGTTDNDDAVYSLSAETGTREWRFPAIVTHDSDVGTAPTISVPGNNGFASGVVYIAGKNKNVYAINLTTGAEIWDFSIMTDDPVTQLQTTSTAALNGRTLYIGSGVGVYALDAVTGAKKWHTVTPAAVFSSPAIAGAKGNKVLLVGDLGGSLRALRLSNGVQLWQYASPTPDAMFWGSFAISNGKAFILGTDGYAYSFVPHHG